MTTLPDDDPFTVLEDARVATVLWRLYSEANRQHLSIIRHFLPHALTYLRRRFMPFSENDMSEFYADKYIAIAAAVRANGGGRVVTTEIVPDKARIARRNFEEAGLADLIDVREGDVLESLATDPTDIDFVLNDGFPMRALDVVKLLAPRIRPGGVVLTDDVGGFRDNYKDYLAFMRDRANGFDSMLIPLKSGTEYSVRR